MAVTITSLGPSATIRVALNVVANKNVEVTFPLWVRQAMVRFVNAAGVDQAGTIEMTGTDGQDRSVNAFAVGNGESFPVILNQSSSDNKAYLSCNNINCYGMIYLISQILPVSVQGTQTIDISGEDIVISSGTLTSITNPVEITNDTGNPISVSDGGSSLTVDGTVEITNDVGNPIPVNGTVEITNDVGNPIPVSDGGSSLTVDGTVEITNDVGNPIPVSDGGSSLTVDGTVEITNDVGNPIPVSDGGSSLTVDGTVEITNDVGNPIPVNGTVDVSGLSYSGQTISDIRLDPKGQIEVSAVKPASSFYEISTAENNPIVQLDFSSGILFNESVITAAAATGSVSIGVSGTNTSMAAISTGATSGAMAMLTSKRFLRTKSGQGGLIRFTAKFTTGVASSYQVAGLLNTEVGYGFGYNGTSFGILNRSQGRVKIHKLTITAGPAGNGNVTVVLNGAAGVVTALTAGWSTAQTAQAIASSTYNGWYAYATSAVVYFVSTGAIAWNGSFTFTDTDATGAAGNMANVQTGVVATDNWTAQSSWSEDKFDGAANATNPSGVTLVPTNGNSYYIMIQPAFGYIEFGIQTSLGRLQPAHRIYQENSSTSLNLYSSSLPVQIESVSTGSTTDLIVYLTNAGLFLQGPKKVNGPKVAVQDSATLAASVLMPIISIRNPRSISSTVNYAEAVATYLSAAIISGTSTVDFQIYRNLTLTAPLWTSIANSILEKDVAATGASGGVLLGGFSMATSGAQSEDLSDMEIILAPGDTITISSFSTGTGNVAATFVCQQDVG